MYTNKFASLLFVSACALALALTGVTVVAHPTQSQVANPTVSVEDASTAPDETTTVEVRLSEAPDGLSGYRVTVTLDDSSTATLTDVSLPDQFGLSNTTVDESEVTFSAADTDNAVTPGATDVVLAELTLRGESTGEAGLIVDVDRVDDEDGNPVEPGTAGGTLTVEAANGNGENPSETTGQLTVSDVRLAPDETATTEIRLSEVPSGLSGYSVTVELGDSTAATLTNASVPSSFGLTDSTVNKSSVSLSAADTDDTVRPGDTDVLLGEVTIRGEATTTTELTVSASRVDDEDGNPATPTTSGGTLTIEATDESGDETGDTNGDETGQSPDTDDSNTIDDNDKTDNTSDRSGPGFGAGVAVVSLIGVALLAANRRETDS